jgi:uncharacterized protein (DUF2141 family)
MTYSSGRIGWRDRACFFGRTATAAVALAALLAPLATAASVEIAVANVHRATGHVRVALCTKTTFLKPNCPYSASAPAQAGETTITVRGVAPGEYAAQAFDDETDAGKVHRNLFGIPREGIGFSNDPPMHLGGPKYKDAAFVVGDSGAQIRFKLRYLLGSGGDSPPASETAASAASMGSDTSASR